MQPHCFLRFCCLLDFTIVFCPQGHSVEGAPGELTSAALAFAISRSCCQCCNAINCLLSLLQTYALCYRRCHLLGNGIMGTNGTEGGILIFYACKTTSNDTLSQNVPSYSVSNVGAVWMTAFEKLLFPLILML